jgi:acyl carrier protein
MQEKTTLEQEVSQMIVEALNLEEVSPESIEPEAPLFRGGLGLDSIDALEISMAVSQKYGFQLRSSDKEVFASLRSLSNHIEKNRSN